MPWYCAKTTGRETRALQYLSRAGLRAFRPEVHKYFIDRRTKVEKHRVLALFPGYVFVELQGVAERAKAQSAIGVAYLLGNWIGAQFCPKEMPSSWVTDLLDAGPIIVGKSVAYRKGHKVKISIGRLGTLIGEVEGVDKAGKVLVNAAMFGKVHQVKLSPNELELAD